MFGMKSAKSGADDVEARRIEALKKSYADSLEKTQPIADSGDYKKCEAVVERLLTSLGKSKLPGDFTKSIRDKSDKLMRDAYVMAASNDLISAVHAGMADDQETFKKKETAAREALAGAMKYKAPAEFKTKVEMGLELARLSGGVHSEGPTRAKPMDTAPKNANVAKPDAAYYAKLAEEEEKLLAANEAEQDEDAAEAQSTARIGGM